MAKEYQHKDLILALRRPIREENQLALFETEEDWRAHWWNMPEFDFANIAPMHSITINFMTAKDMQDFAQLTGMKLNEESNSKWFPPRKNPKPGQYYFTGPKSGTRYPVCIPSKGRHDVQKTGKALDELGVAYTFFVEQHEFDLYAAALGAEKVVSMPFSNLGQGSIPARNFIWDWAVAQGVERYWLMDDNIMAFGRLCETRKLRVRGGAFFRAMEDFVDRYENVSIAGPHNYGFANATSAKQPFRLNSRVYSCSLIKTDLPYRWRGRYNEDTDLCLRMLKDGWCSVLFISLLMDKMPTAFSKRGGLKGGNTDSVYNTNDYRLAFAESLQQQHPEHVKVKWKYNRWHHEVDYSEFKRNKLKLKPSLTPVAFVNNYGMRLTEKDSATAGNDDYEDDC